MTVKLFQHQRPVSLQILLANIWRDNLWSSQTLGCTVGPTLEKKKSLRVSAPAITVNQWTTQFKLWYCIRNWSASDTSALIKLHHSLEGGSFMPGAVLCSSLEFWQLQYHKHLEGITAHRLQWERSVLWMRFDIYLASGNSSSVSFRKCPPELSQRLPALTYDPCRRTCATLDYCWLGNLKNFRVAIKMTYSTWRAGGGLLARNRTPPTSGRAVTNSREKLAKFVAWTQQSIHELSVHGCI